MNKHLRQVILFVLVLKIPQICTIDFTAEAFGEINDTIISAFGDFNSDELTDVFVRSTDGRTLEILLASYPEPLLRRSPNTKCVFKELIITSIVPGDFDGDAFMDLLITTKSKPKPNATESTHPKLLDVYINWGGSDVLNCTDENAGPLFQMIGEPVALDYNSDMIIDLFGLNENGNRAFWIFNETRQAPEEVLMVLPTNQRLSQLLVPHSHAYLDLNNDFKADLFLTTENGFEIWHGLEDKGFAFFNHQPLPTQCAIKGQSIFLDIELTGNILHILPCCIDATCHDSRILAYVNGRYRDIAGPFNDDIDYWKLIVPNQMQQSNYQDTITLRAGDFNLDGYPDLLVTLQSILTGIIRTVLLENVELKNSEMKRGFEFKWNHFVPYSNVTVAGAFYDFYEDGVLDVIFVKHQTNGTYSPIAFLNPLDYDANFAKVMVLSGLTNKNTPSQRINGSNLPGPRIAYQITRPDGVTQEGTSAQIPQSGYFALQLPYFVLGLGQTPSIVESLSVGLSGSSSTWTHITSNSQIITIPLPITDPTQWKIEIFIISPSKKTWSDEFKDILFFIGFIIIGIIVLKMCENKSDRSRRI